MGGDSGKALIELKRYLSSESSLSLSSSVQLVEEPQEMVQRHSAVEGSENGAVFHNTSEATSNTLHADVETQTLDENDELPAPPEPSWKGFQRLFLAPGESKNADRDVSLLVLHRPVGFSSWTLHPMRH